MQRILKTLTTSVAVALLASASACVYHMPIQQGNYLDPAVLAQIKPGMTRAQVRFLLGTPITPVGFDNSRWEYDYWLKTERAAKLVRGHATVLFSNDLVASINSDVKAPVMTDFTERPASAPEAGH
jgi:outer membrane protein assembly factor BamE